MSEPHQIPERRGGPNIKWRWKVAQNISEAKGQDTGLRGA